MTFEFSGTLLRFTDYTKEVQLDAPTFGDAVDLLVGKFPPLRAALLDSSGRIRGTHRLFLNGEMVNGAALTHPLSATDHVEILTSIAGG